jgi:hypothetical protein
MALACYKYFYHRMETFVSVIRTYSENDNDGTYNMRSIGKIKKKIMLIQKFSAGQRGEMYPGIRPRALPCNNSTNKKFYSQATIL